MTHDNTQYDSTKASTLADAVGFITLTVLCGLVARLLGTDVVSVPLWLLMYAACIACSVLLWRHGSGPSSPWGWLLLSVNSVLLASIFFGANAGLDVLKGPDRVRFDVAKSLGFELWAVFCPGLTVVGVAGWLRSLWLRP
jgi:hypothetical protein